MSEYTKEFNDWWYKPLLDSAKWSGGVQDKDMMRYKDLGKQSAFLAWVARDQEITKLKKALEVANKTIGFYGNPESWINRSGSSWVKSSPRSHADSELIRNYHHPKTDWIETIDVGGKRAREAQKQIKEIMEG